MTWSPPTGVLGRIVAEAMARVAELRTDPATSRALERDLAAAPETPGFRDALLRECVAVIAEVKRRSPSKGEINAALSAADQARAYEAGGAAAISVLTEPAHFAGSLRDLREASGAVAIPVLRKDFLVDELQLMEARAAGASAVLLIARALSPATLARLYGFARELGLESLVEVRSRSELDRALEIGAGVIGVNERDLETLEMDPAVRERLIPGIPRSVAVVAESGIRSVEDVERVAELGADAVLVGSSLSASATPESDVRALASVPRVGRVTLAG
jgi:indole-3-glycerol phosphate synthase